jgi:hypothetical protein
VAASRAAARLSSILRREAHPTRERVARSATVEEDPAAGVGVGLELERQPDAGGLDHGSTVWQDAPDRIGRRMLIFSRPHPELSPRCDGCA